MMTLVITSVDEQLRGYLTRFLQEISGGVFVGSASARVRDNLWKRCQQHCRKENAHAVLSYSYNNEQGYKILSENNIFIPIDIEGVVVMKKNEDSKKAHSGKNQHYSNAWKYKHYCR